VAWRVAAFDLGQRLGVEIVVVEVEVTFASDEGAPFAPTG